MLQSFCYKTVYPFFPELSTFKGFVLHTVTNTFAACISHLQYLDPVTIKLLTFGASYNYLLLLLFLMGIALSFLSSFPKHLRDLWGICYIAVMLFDFCLSCLFSYLSKILRPLRTSSLHEVFCSLQCLKWISQSKMYLKGMAMENPIFPDRFAFSAWRAAIAGHSHWAKQLCKLNAHLTDVNTCCFWYQNLSEKCTVPVAHWPFC